MTKKNTDIKKRINAQSPSKVQAISMEDVQDKIIILRGQRVLLDRDVAELYGVGTKEINQAVKNNPKKFPYGFIFGVDEYEKNELVKNFDRFNSLKHSVVTPNAFTERGLYMLATIMKGDQAIETALAIVNTYATVKELARTVRSLQETESQAEQKPLLKRTGELIGDVLGSDLSTTGTETELELNFAMLKVKHTIKREKKK